MKLFFFILTIINLLNAEITSPPDEQIHDCISELPLGCESKPLLQCEFTLTPICEECKAILPPDCEQKPLNECSNLPPQCKNSSNTTIEPQATFDMQTSQPEPTTDSQTSEPLAEDGTLIQIPHDCENEIPIECIDSPLIECKLELTPVCQECKEIMPPQCVDKPLKECNNPPPQCKMPPPSNGNQIPPPKPEECVNENAGIYHPETLEANEGEEKTTLDIPRDDGGASGFEIDADGFTTIGIKPPAGKPPLTLKAPPCSQIEMKEDGSFDHQFHTSDGVRAELNASANGDISLQLRPQNGKDVEFKAPTGSNVEMRDDGSFNNAFSNESGLESELNISKTGEFEFKLKPPADKPPVKVKAPAGAKMEIAEDGSFKNYIEHENGIEHELDGDSDGYFDFTLKHPDKNGFNFKMPPGSDIEIKDDGSIRDVLAKNDKRVELDGNDKGEFEVKLELKDKDTNKSREFLGLDGSEASMGEEGNVTSIYYDYNNSLVYDMEIEENGTLIAKISKLVPKKSRAVLGVVEYLQEELLTYSMLTTYLDGGLWIDTSNSSNYREATTQAKIDANYTTESEFSIDIDENLTILFSPLEKSTFTEITYLDKSKEITLLSGKCNITIKKDSNITLENLNELKINSSGIYIKDDLDTKEVTSLKLKNGWNLISIPVSALINLDTIKSEKVWSYNNKWISNPSFLEYKNGYWAFLDSNTTLNFEGFVYNVELSNLKTNSWHLLGSGIDLTTNKDETIYVFRDNEWIKNPQIIYKGEGFWIKK